jgi:hypothetical protein
MESIVLDASDASFKRAHLVETIVVCGGGESLDVFEHLGETSPSVGTTSVAAFNRTIWSDYIGSNYYRDQSLYLDLVKS